MNLPSGPKATFEDAVFDMDALPKNGPFNVFMGNIAYAVVEDDIHDFFRGLHIRNIRLMTDNGRPKGFGYVEFETRDDLSEALKMDGGKLAGRSVKIDLANQQERDTRNKPYEQRQGRDGGGREGYTSAGGVEGRNEADNDWRAGPRSTQADSYSTGRSGGDRYGNQRRDGGGYTAAGGVDGRNETDSDWRGGTRSNAPAGSYTNSRYGNDRPSYNQPSSDPPAYAPRQPTIRDGSAADETSIEGEGGKERPRLQLQARAGPVADQAAPVKKPSSNIFGSAKPVDTRAAEQVAEEKILKGREESKWRGT